MKQVVALLAIAFAAGCSSFSHASGNPAVFPPFERLTAGSTPIKHVVIIVQENRSFDNLFQGYPGADTVASGKGSSGQTIALQPMSLAGQYFIDHSLTAMIAACDGTGTLPGTKCRNDGFDKEAVFGGPKYPQYVYVPHADSKPYFDMAHQWVLADHMHQSHLDESFVSHQYIIAAQAQSSVDLPYGFWGCDGGPSDMVATIGKKRSTADTSEPASITKRWGTNWITPSSRGIFTRATSTIPAITSGRVIRRSGTSASVPTGSKTLLPRRSDFSRTWLQVRWRTSPGSRRSARTPITSTVEVDSDPRGSARSSTP